MKQSPQNDVTQRPSGAQQSRDAFEAFSAPCDAVQKYIRSVHEDRQRVADGEVSK